MRTLLFHRHFDNFTGGHLKVWDYFNHTASSGTHRARVHFTPGSRWDATNPWLARRAEVLPAWQPRQADALFLGGFDWQALPEAERDHWPRPVFNLVQHVRHGDPDHPLTAFLRHRAVRICVSEEVRAAIVATRRVNGPVFVIANGIDPAALPPAPAPADRGVDWLICGLKEPALARAGSQARGHGPAAADWGRVETLTRLLPRPEFLAALANARRAILIPSPGEGFYLPALEAMALGSLVICPDCVGNRSFCLPGINMLQPAVFDEAGILASLEEARRLAPAGEAFLLANARDTAQEHSLQRERAAFQTILSEVGDRF